MAGLVPTAILEGTLRDEVVWRTTSTLVIAALVPLLLWRRTRPLAVVAITFGSVLVVDLFALAADVEWEALYTAIFFLLFPYALFRWGSGREAAAGLAIMLCAASVSAFNDTDTVGDWLGGYGILLLCAVVGLAVRLQDQSHRRGIEHVRSQQRAELARDLHDTVAHHVSAIAVQAQAGRTLAERDPAAAVRALEVVEEAASRTLVEMRKVVGALRGDDAPILAPQPGVADIGRLAQLEDAGLRVDIAMHGDLDEVAPAVDAAIYRLAQESITNALRHARDATRIDVRVQGEAGEVRLTVRDDGLPSRPSGRNPGGFGIIGMTERVELLGGTLAAGPVEGRGWRVEARLPRNGGPA